MLLFSSLCGFFLLCGLPSLGIFSLLCIIGPLATVSSSCFPSLFSLAASSVSLFLLCSSLRFGWSSGHFVAFYVLFGLTPLGVLAREVLFLMSRGFSSSCLGVPGGLPRVFFSSPVPFLSSSRGLLRCRGALHALCFAPFWRLLGGFVCLLSAVLFLSSIPGFRLSRSSCLCLSLFSISFLHCLIFLFGSIFLFCALPSGPPGVSPVTALSSAGHPASLSSVVAAASSSSFWFSPIDIVLLCCSPLGVVSLGSCSAGASCHLVLLPVLIFTP